MSKRASRQLAEAAALVPGIMTDASEINATGGFTYEYLEALGLDRQALKSLERSGAAIRAYTQNVYLPGDKRPNGSIIPTDAMYTERGKGHSTRWILVKS